MANKIPEALIDEAVEMLRAEMPLAHVARALGKNPANLAKALSRRGLYEPYDHSSAWTEDEKAFVLSHYNDKAWSPRMIAKGLGRSRNEVIAKADRLRRREAQERAEAARSGASSWLRLGLRQGARQPYRRRRLPGEAPGCEIPLAASPGGGVASNRAAAPNMPMDIASTKDRFWRSVRVAGAGECWLWSGSRMNPRRGKLTYGRFYVVGNKVIAAHRAAWMLTHGPIPDGLKVCHSCDQPTCCNPAHLYLGTDAEARRPRGERHWLAKITEKDAAAIRASSQSLTKLAEQYGVHFTTIGRIKRGQTWQVARPEAQGDKKSSD